MSSAGQAASGRRAAGDNYLVLLRALHTILKPRTYFEIGSEAGISLSLAECASVAVDPAFGLKKDVIRRKPSLHLYHTTSDAFFRSVDPTAILGDKIELAFLDGMHLYEFLLRDFMNTERYCRRNSIIALHDCVPSDLLMTRRFQNNPEKTLPPSWTGDVWKMVPILKKYRPDLAITVTDASPTGLVLITNLDPSSTVLGSSYADIIREMAEVDLASYGLDRFLDECALVPTGSLTEFEGMAKRFWL
jgi:hypothetical protein